MIIRHIGTRPITVLVTLAIAAMALASGFAASADSATPPTPNASDFTAQIDNPWYPLKPGTTYVYRGIKDGHVARDVLIVTRQTRTITGIPCVVIQDRLYLDGHLHERTTEWYSQDKQGNVWYLGENTAASVKVPRFSSSQAVLTKEWTPLEPGVIDHKLYVRGIGTVLEMTVKGGHERLALISMTSSE